MIVKPPWKPIEPSKTNGIGERSPAKLIEMLQQFENTKNPRYQMKGGSTYCNIFCWDATKALQCEIPHIVDGIEKLANQMIDWLDGEAAGWKKIDQQEAEHLASFGHPVIATYKNPHGHGHMAMLLPNGHIVQAGIAPLYDAPLKSGFGSRPVKFFAHE